MRVRRAVLSSVLIVLLLALSFNAYACLFPLFPVSSAGMEGCPDSAEQSARSGCDAFTTLGPLSGKPATLDLPAPLLIVSLGGIDMPTVIVPAAPLSGRRYALYVKPTVPSASSVLRL
jgi:hypothetical protein